MEGRLSTQEYISLVDETGRCIVDGKQSISEDLKPILARLNMNESAWRQNSQSQGKLFYRVIGKARELTRLAMEKEKAWFKGLGSAVLIFGME